MCTRANRASVPDSFHALTAAALALASAIVALAVAAATIPLRTLRSQPPRRARVDSTTHIEIQVHLSDGERVRAIERSCRTGLKRAARTWAPFALPLDRVEVIPSAPPLGKRTSSTPGSTVVPGRGTTRARSSSSRWAPLRRAASCHPTRSRVLWLARSSGS
jgi:hypothetical protein